MYPKKGQTFTISENKKTGDGSYSSEVLTCLCVNDLHVLCHNPKQVLLIGNIVLLKANHDFALMPPEQEEIQPEPKFWPVKNQPVLVRDNSGLFVNRYATGEKNDDGKFFAYAHGASSYNSDAKRSLIWDECKPDTMAPSLINWIEHDGSCIIPIDHDATVIVNRTDLAYTVTIQSECYAKDVGWSNVDRYLIIAK